MTDFQFRCWTYLITYVDDYGRGSADPEILKGFVFPRRKRVTESDIEKTLAELAGIGCINLYIVDGESYFYFPNWGEHQRIQTKKSKFPEPTIEKNINSPYSTVGHGDLPPESESESNTNISVENSQDEFIDADKNVEKESDKPPNQDKSELDGDELFEKIYGTYPRKTGKSDGKVAFIGYLTTGRKLKGQGTVKLNHVQIGYAIRHYAGEVAEKDEEYIKQFGTFMGSENGKYPIVDYIEASKPEYEAAMFKKYGEEWQKIKYKYRFKGVSGE